VAAFSPTGSAIDASSFSGLPRAHQLGRIWPHQVARFRLFRRASPYSHVTPASTRTVTQRQLAHHRLGMQSSSCGYFKDDLAVNLVDQLHDEP